MRMDFHIQPNSGQANPVDKMPLLPTQRHLFDIPEDIAYFNCASNSPLLIESQKRLIGGIALKSHPWQIKPINFFKDAETIRTLAAGIFGSDADGYAVIPAASYGFSAAARAIEPHLQKGDVIVLMAEEFPSNVLTWKRIAQEKGILIRTVPVPPDGNWTQAIIDHLDEKVKVLSLSTCHWMYSAYVDIATIRKAAHANCICMVDATQTLGAMPFPLEESKPDFLIAAGYKWLMSPYGFGLMYVAPEWRNARPLEETWLARENAENFSTLADYSDTYLPGARRFDMGEKCISTILPGAIAALEQIQAWGVQRISNTLARINQQMAVRLASLGFRLADVQLRCPHLFGANLPVHYKGNLVNELSERNIYVSQRGRGIRFAPHLHVNEQDINRLLETIEELVKHNLSVNIR